MSNSNSKEPVLQLTISVAEVTQLKEENAALKNQVSELKEEIKSLKSQLESERNSKPNPSVIMNDRYR
jgi:predicted RNase H-like nuclease (RuvC/YqgF family)